MADQPSVRVSKRVEGFSYAIRNIVSEARKVEAEGRPVRYLNIGDPVPFGFQPPAHLIEAVERAMREGHNGYGPSPGIPLAREAVAADYSEKGLSLPPERVVLTSGASEGIELALSALVDPGDEVLVPLPTYPLYSAVLAKLGAATVYYRTDPERGWRVDLEHVRASITPKTRGIVVIHPNNPTGAVYPESDLRALIALAEQHGLVLLADEVYADMTYGTPIPRPIGSLAPEAAVLSFGSLSKAFLVPGWRAGWVAVGRSSRLDGLLAAILKFADGRLCSPVPMQYAVHAALTHDRAHQAKVREALRERAEVVARRANSIPGMRCVPPQAAFYAMPRVALPPDTTDERFVVDFLRASGILLVHGSGFGLPASAGFFRMVFLPPPAELEQIFDALAAHLAKLRG